MRVSAALLVMAVMSGALFVSPAGAQTCACFGQLIDAQIENADGAFVDSIVSRPANEESVDSSGVWNLTITDWIKGDTSVGDIAVEADECGGWGQALAGEEVAGFFELDDSGLAVGGSCGSTPELARAYIDPEPLSDRPGQYYATSSTSPPLVLDADGFIVAVHPDRSRTEEEVTVGCPNQRVAAFLHGEVVVEDVASFEPVERWPFNRNTRALLCPDAETLLGVAGPFQHRRVIDVRTGEALTGELTSGSPAHAVSDLVVFSAQADTAPASIRVLSRSTDVETVLGEPAELASAGEVAVASLQISPDATRVAFSLTSGAYGSKFTEIFLYDLTTNTLVARADAAPKRGQVWWLDNDRLLFRTNQGVASIYDARDLSVITELGADMRWVSYLEGDRLVGVGERSGTTPAHGFSTRTMPIAGGEITVLNTLAHLVTVSRLVEPVTMTTTGSAFGGPIEIPIPSPTLDGLEAVDSANGTLFVATETAVETPAPAADSQVAQTADPIEGAQEPEASTERNYPIVLVAVAAAAGAGVFVAARRKRA